MKNTFGSSISVTLFGESHGEAIGAVVDGLPAGIKVDYEYINKKLAQRKPCGRISTARVEADGVNIVSGAFNGFTTGTPLTVLIKNENTKSGDYANLADIPRPSHADYVAQCKYRGFQDFRGGGHFSGRLTAPLVAVGAILSSALAEKGIKLGTHISRIQKISDTSFSSYEADVSALDEKYFPTLSESAGKEMQDLIEQAAKDGDSVGGILETAVIGLPLGVGEPWFDTMEGVLSHILFSVPAIKGVEFGSGFGFADMYGSEANDPFATDGERIYTKTNNNGGINGGITNGMPLLFRCAIKPTPSIFKEQQSVSLSEMKNTNLLIKGRHDPAIIHRARAVIDAVTAIAVSDMLTVKFGTDYLAEGNK